MGFGFVNYWRDVVIIDTFVVRPAKIIVVSLNSTRLVGKLATLVSDIIKHYELCCRIIFHDV